MTNWVTEQFNQQADEGGQTDSPRQWAKQYNANSPIFCQRYFMAV